MISFEFPCSEKVTEKFNVPKPVEMYEFDVSHVPKGLFLEREIITLNKSVKLNYL